jgi:transcriptional regulator with XRE-family HTH domain
VTDDIRQRLCAAMGGYEGDDWLERASAILEAEWRRKMQRRVYDISTVGARIRAARESLGMSQPQLAMRVSVHPMRVSGWERGTENVPAQKFAGLVTALRPACTRAWLLMDTDEGGPDVPVEVVAKQHSAAQYRWLKKQQQWLKANAEARARNEARKARQQQNQNETTEPK